MKKILNESDKPFFVTYLTTVLSLSGLVVIIMLVQSALSTIESKEFLYEILLTAGILSVSLVLTELRRMF